MSPVTDITAPRQDEIDAFWVDAKVHANLNLVSGYLGVTSLEGLEPPAVTWGLSRQEADRVAAAVVDGSMTATSAPLDAYQAQGVPVPEAGNLEIVCDGDGHPRALVATTDVTVQRFDDVDEETAAAEAQGDGSLRAWQQAMRTAVDGSGISVDGDTQIVVRRFTVLHGR